MSCCVNRAAAQQIRVGKDWRLTQSVCSDCSIRLWKVDGRVHWFSNLWKLHPASLTPRFEARLSQLNPFRAFAKRKPERDIFDDMAQEHFPLHLETILKRLVIRHFFPVIEEVVFTGQIRIPNWPRSI